MTIYAKTFNVFSILVVCLTTCKSSKAAKTNILLILFSVHFSQKSLFVIFHVFHKGKYLAFTSLLIHEYNYAVAVCSYLQLIIDKATRTKRYNRNAVYEQRILEDFVNSSLAQISLSPLIQT